ncbi:CHASE domain-containing protein, partial [Candidatus Sumerlaeota bacterium]|nr:CHASE domain-containing protein [Candidatus Sumerlaeota bacterium]
MDETNHASRPWRHPYRASAITLAAGLALSILCFAVARRWDFRRTESEFAIAAANRVASLRREIASNLDALRSVDYFYESSELVKRDEFKEFTQPIISHHKSLEALEWIPVVPGTERDAFVSQARAEGFSNFQIFELEQERPVPVRERGNYYPIFFIEPSEGNDSAMGYDMG